MIGYTGEDDVTPHWTNHRAARRRKRERRIDQSGFVNSPMLFMVLDFFFFLSLYFFFFWGVQVWDLIFCVLPSESYCSGLYHSLKPPSFTWFFPVLFFTLFIHLHNLFFLVFFPSFSFFWLFCILFFFFPFQWLIHTFSSSLVLLWTSNALAGVRTKAHGFIKRVTLTTTPYILLHIFIPHTSPYLTTVCLIPEHILPYLIILYYILNLYLSTL